MGSFSISENLIYQEFENESLMFKALKRYLDNGYKIKETIFLCPVITNGLEEIILSYLHIDEVNEDIKKKLERLNKPIKCMKPDYNDTILNIIGGIRNNYGYDCEFKDTHNVFDKQYKNCIVMLIDGMGVNVLSENLDEDTFLRKNVMFTEHAIYPSTTAASTTATISGLTPLESGWTGWSNYIKELDREIVLFNGKNYYTEEPTGRTGFEFLPYKPFFNDMRVRGYVITPDFSKPQTDINEVLNESLTKLNGEQNVVEYVYWPEPDAIMHEKGAYSEEAKECLKDINDKLERYVGALPLDTILIISADHGHIPVLPINIYDCELINQYLKTKPSNDARCIVFRVKDGMGDKFERMFNALFGAIYKLYPKMEAIKLGYFGNPNGHIHTRIEDFLGDYVAVATNKYYFNFFGQKDFIFKSHHAGITRDEMEVPVIVIRK